jgi:hypothetical protein
MKSFDQTLFCGCRLVQSAGILYHRPCYRMECVDDYDVPDGVLYVNVMAKREKEDGFLTDEHKRDLIRLN